MFLQCRHFHYLPTLSSNVKSLFTRVNYCKTFFVRCAAWFSAWAGLWHWSKSSASIPRSSTLLCMRGPVIPRSTWWLFSPPCVVEVRGMMGRCENQLLLTIWSSPVSGGEECRSHTHTFRALLMLLWTGSHWKGVSWQSRSWMCVSVC